MANELTAAQKKQRAALAEAAKAAEAAAKDAAKDAAKAQKAAEKSAEKARKSAAKAKAAADRLARYPGRAKAAGDDPPTDPNGGWSAAEPLVVTVGNDGVVTAKVGEGKNARQLKAFIGKSTQLRLTFEIAPDAPDGKQQRQLQDIADFIAKMEKEGSFVACCQSTGKCRP